MSRDYWGITGYGIELDNDVINAMEEEKIRKLVNELNPEMHFTKNVFNDETFCGEPYENLGEFLCELDETGTMTWDSDGFERVFFLYTPPYPWHDRGIKQPENSQQVMDNIMKILEKVCDFNNKEEYEKVKEKIDYIDTYGCC